MAKTTGAKLFAEIIQGYGLTHVFYVPQVISKALVAMEDMNIRRVVAHSEKAAGIHGRRLRTRARSTRIVYRATDRCVQSRVGFARRVHGPLARDRDIRRSRRRVTLRHAYQEVEDFEQFTSVTKANFNVDSAARMPDLLRQAFRTATSGMPGPGAFAIPGTRIGRAAR